MSQSNLPGSKQGQPANNLQLRGGAAIVAPPSAFPSGIPGNALIVLPLSQPSEELTQKLTTGAVAVTLDEMWKMLGFNGPAVQVQDQEGRPIAIGLDDLLAGLEQHWQESPDDLQRARIYAQELLKYSRFEQAEKVLQKLVASGAGNGRRLACLGRVTIAAREVGQGGRHSARCSEPAARQPLSVPTLGALHEGQGRS